jgi:hypothetical protein
MDNFDLKKYLAENKLNEESPLDKSPVEWMIYFLVYNNLVDNSPGSKFWEVADEARERELQQKRNS